ncbi:MAG: helix-turn-helix domain-containing protein [Bryobacteraceae bacterium]|jgi:hypothetical protein
MQTDSLNPNQEQVLTLIALGYSATAAAQQAGVHRNTIVNWLKIDAFRKALEQARFEKKILFWDQVHAFVAEALNNLRTLMYHPDASPNVRFRATKALLDHVTLYLPGDASLPIPDPPEITPAVHKNAQSAPAPLPEEPSFSRESPTPTPQTGLQNKNGSPENPVSPPKQTSVA